MTEESLKEKRALAALLLASLESELENMRRAARDAREAATHEEAKPENDKDTRALEASYLAGAQAARVRELEGSIKAMSGMAILDLEGKIIQASALVVLEDEEEVKTTFFVAPFGGGKVLTPNEFTNAPSPSAQVVTPQSPLGKALLGKSEGDVIEVRGTDIRGNATKREMTIASVR